MNTSDLSEQDRTALLDYMGKFGSFVVPGLEEKLQEGKGELSVSDRFALGTAVAYAEQDDTVFHRFCKVLGV